MAFFYTAELVIIEHSMLAISGTILYNPAGPVKLFACFQASSPAATDYRDGYSSIGAVGRAQPARRSGQVVG